MKRKRRITVTSMLVVLIVIFASIQVFADHQPAKESTMATEVVVKSDAGNVRTIINEEPLEIQYRQTKVDSAAGVENNIYKDVSDNQYVLGNDGELLGFYKKSAKSLTRSSKSVSLSQKELKSRCEAFLAQYIDVYRYECKDQTFDEAEGCYVFTYYRMIQGIKSSDFAFVYITPSGEIPSFAAPNKDCFNGVLVPELTMSDYDEIAKQEIAERYSESSNYTIEDRILQKTKAGLELIVIFSVNYVQDGQEYSQGDSLVLPIV